jgi:phage baseplate assembly protein W
MSSNVVDNGASFLGRGWSFPPAFGAGGKEVAMVAGEEDIGQSLRIIFATELGERVMRADFGCQLRGYLFEEVDNTLLTKIRSAVSDAILYHEPRIRPDVVDVSESDQTPGLIAISVTYTVRTSNTRFNMVFPFYLIEATARGL